MKKMKRIASLLLAMIMVLAMTVSVQAASEYSITVKNDNTAISIDGKEYSAYKLFDVTYATDTAGNPTGAYSYTIAEEFAGFTYTVGEASYAGEDLVAYVATLENNPDALNSVAEAALEYVQANAITAAKTAIAADEEAVLELDEAGYYLVAGDAFAAADADQVVTAACALTTTNPAAEVNVKADVPSVDKVIVKADSNDGGEGNGTAQDVGSVVDFKVTSDVPDMTGYETYELIFNDTLSDGLTKVDADGDGVIDVEITIGGEEYKAFTVTQTTAQSFTITFNNFIDQKTNAGKEIVITYAATINENALTSDVETNTVNLEYSNNPNDTTSKEQTPDKTVYVYDFDIVIDKYAADETTDDATDNERLAGAKFVLKNTEGKFYKIDGNIVSWVDAQADATEVTTDEYGAASFVGLDADTYYLVETEAPDGYNKLKDAIEVVITAEYNTDGTLKPGKAVSVDDGQYSQTQGIENNTGTELPSTGGMGTTIFYVIGGVIVAAVVVLLITRRRMAAE